jgi:hypothetical protein
VRPAQSNWRSTPSRSRSFAARSRPSSAPDAGAAIPMAVQATASSTV